jgi:hypothetical protein
LIFTPDAAQPGRLVQQLEKSMKRYSNYSAVALIFLGVLMLAMIGGWIANIVKLIGLPSLELTGMTIGRIAGIFVPPLGGVMGYF